MGSRRSRLAGALLVATSLSLALACSSATLLGEGASCSQATECLEGLICAPAKGGTRTCTRDLDGLGKVPDLPKDAAAANDDGGDATAVSDSGADTSTPPPDAGSPPVKDASTPPTVDASTTPDTGTPADAAAAAD